MSQYVVVQPLAREQTTEEQPAALAENTRLKLSRKRQQTDHVLGFVLREGHFVAVLEEGQFVAPKSAFLLCERFCEIKFGKELINPTLS